MNENYLLSTEAESTLKVLYRKSKKDKRYVAKVLAKKIISEVKPIDVKTAYLPISYEQGRFLFELIINRELKSVVEFGTSFGISTVFLGNAVKKTGGHVITSEILKNKCAEATKNFARAGLTEQITLLEGDARDTLQSIHGKIDLLILDGWKELYLSVFNLLENQFHKDTLIFVDNTNMKGVKVFLEEIRTRSAKYNVNQLCFEKGNTSLISLK